MMYVICFYWQGDRWNSNVISDLPDDFHYRTLLRRIGAIDLTLASKYVNNLFKGVTKYASKKFKFICFTNEKLDLETGIEMRSFPLVTKKGVLPRLYMFSKESGLWGKQVLALDLDLIIVNSLKPFMDYTGRLCVCKSRGDLIDGNVISFKAGERMTRIIWDSFISDVKGAEKITIGRERKWLQKVAQDFGDVWTNVAPNTIVRIQDCPRKCSQIKMNIISCNGSNRPHLQIKRYPWLKEYWE